MTKKGDKTEGPGTTDTSKVAALSRELSDRERQLRDLTEQSLGFLEELAESRRRNGDRDQLAERLSELERLLGDARRRLQHAGGVVLQRTDGQPEQTGNLAVVFWGAESLAAATASLMVCGDVPVAWVGRPEAVPADSVGQATKLQRIVHREAVTPAQCWNLGMAATTADYVLFLGPDLQLGTPPQLPGERLSGSAVLLCPRVEGDGVASLGSDATELLRLRPRPAPAPARDLVVEVPWANPLAFVLRRAAFDGLGLLDEGLLGHEALLDFTLRAKRRNFVVVGVPNLTVRAGHNSELGEVERATQTAESDRQRLMVLAAHRPELLGKGLADVPLLWQLPAAAAPGCLAQLLARLPATNSTAEHGAVLDQVAIGLVQHAMPNSRLGASLRDCRMALLRGLIEIDLPGREEMVAALQRAEQQSVGDPVDDLARLMADIVLHRQILANAVRGLQQRGTQMRTEKEEIDRERHAQAARAERAEGAREAAQKQLDQVQLWLREANAKLQEAGVRYLDETRQMQGQLEVSRGHLLESQRQLEATRGQLEAAQRQLVESQRQLEATRLQYRELEAEHMATDRGLRDLREEVGAMARIVGLTSIEQPQSLKARLGQLHEESARFAETLQAAGAKDASVLLEGLDALGRRIAAADQTVIDRERWIAMLLHEVGKRRFVPRRLLDHEQELLDRVRQRP